MDLKRHGIEIATGGNILPAMVAYKQFPGMEGAAVLLLRHAQEPGQRGAGGAALQASSRHRRTSSPPAASAAAMAVVTALKKTNGDTSTEQADQDHGRHEL
jgi:branched-chain amino acid transport system substrate-binding protein